MVAGWWWFLHVRRTFYVLRKPPGWWQDGDGFYTWEEPSMSFVNLPDGGRMVMVFNMWEEPSMSFVSLPDGGRMVMVFLVICFRCWLWHGHHLGHRVHLLQRDHHLGVLLSLQVLLGDSAVEHLRQPMEHPAVCDSIERPPESECKPIQCNYQRNIWRFGLQLDWCEWYLKEEDAQRRILGVSICVLIRST